MLEHVASLRVKESLSYKPLITCKCGLGLAKLRVKVPVKLAVGKCLRHCPAVEVCCVNIHNKDLDSLGRYSASMYLLFAQT